jgi:flagellin
MSLSLLTNIPSLYAQGAIAQSQRQLNSLAAQLASGSSLGSGDAASLAVSADMAAQIASLGQAQRNTADAASFTQVADASMGQVNNLLTRMSTLAVQAGNGTLTSSQRGAIDSAYQQLSAEVERVSNSASYNSQPLLNGNGGTVSFQVGANSTPSDRVSMTIPNTTTGNLGIQGTSLATQAGASQALGALQAAISNVGSQRASVGATQQVLQSAADNAAAAQYNLTAARSRIADTDYARATSDYLKTKIQQQAAISMLSQANAGPAAALALLSPARLY